MTPVEAFFAVYEDLPRHGPGSDSLTRDMLERLGPLAHWPRILELGCGIGRATTVLAEATGGSVVAVDLHAPFVKRLRARASQLGIAARIDARVADFGALAFDDEPFDLLWSEGAAYHLGFRNALAKWRPWLRPGGFAVLTECTWLTDTPAAEAAEYFARGYPSMGTIASNTMAAREEGFEVLDTVTFPSSAWWDEYYKPLAARCERLAGQPELAEVVKEAREEIELKRRCDDSYSYVGFLLRART